MVDELVQEGYQVEQDTKRVVQEAHKAEEKHVSSAATAPKAFPCPREILWHATSCDRVTWLASSLCLFVQILGNDPPLSSCHCEVMNILFDTVLYHDRIKGVCKLCLKE